MNYDTNPHGKSSAELEREIAEERERLDRDVHSLQDQLSVGALFDRFAGPAAHEGGAFARNLGTSIRDNPMPAVLIGLGVAWMMSGRGGPQARPVNYGYSQRDAYDPDYDPYYAGAADASQVGIPYGDVDPDMEGNDARSVIGGEGMADTGRGPGAGDRARHAAGSAKAGAHAAGDAAKSGARGIGDAARSGAAGVGHAASSGAAGVSRAARSGAAGVGYAARSGAGGVSYAARSGAAGVGSAARSAAGYARTAGDDAAEAFHHYPLAAGALALAAGALIGALVPNSRRENELMGEQAADARAYARGEFDRNLDRAERAAGAVADEARHMGDEARESFEGQASQQDGRKAVDAAEQKVREGADRLRKAGEAEWNKDDKPAGTSSASTGSATPGSTPGSSTAGSTPGSSTAASTPGTTKPTSGV